MRKVCVRRASLPGGASTVAVLVAIGLIWLLSGCGASSHRSPQTAGRPSKPQPPPVCRPVARGVVARAAGVAVGAVRAVAGSGNNGEPECHFAAGRVRVVVNVDSSPQPYARLERAIVEAGQQFGTERTFAPPQTVSHLGLDASWFPDLGQLLTSDGHALITVSVHWPSARRGARRALAAVLARIYLGRSDAQLAKGPAPSG